jgi:hypothetical protein
MEAAISGRSRSLGGCPSLRLDGPGHGPRFPLPPPAALASHAFPHPPAGQGWWGRRRKGTKARRKRGSLRRAFAPSWLLFELGPRGAGRRAKPFGRHTDPPLRRLPLPHRAHLLPPPPGPGFSKRRRDGTRKRRGGRSGSPVLYLRVFSSKNGAEAPGSRQMRSSRLQGPDGAGNRTARRPLARPLCLPHPLC